MVIIYKSQVVDECWTNSFNNVYVKNGFSSVKISKPGYFYVKNNQRFHRYNFTKNKLVKAGFDQEKTERQIMNENVF